MIIVLQIYQICTDLIYNMSINFTYKVLSLMKTPQFWFERQQGLAGGL